MSIKILAKPDGNSAELSISVDTNLVLNKDGSVNLPNGLLVANTDIGTVINNAIISNNISLNLGTVATKNVGNSPEDIPTNNLLPEIVNINIADLPWLSTPIGGYITPFNEPPTDNPKFRYIKCSAGDDYNDGILINETVSGTYPTNTAAAEINLPNSPMHGLVVPLINTTGHFIGAGESSTLENDMLQNITGNIAGYWNRGLFHSSLTDGVFQTFNKEPSTIAPGNEATSQPSKVDFNASRVARTGNRTQPRTHRLVHYRRIL